MIIEIFGNDFKDQLELERSSCTFPNAYNATINITVIVPREDPAGSGMPIPFTFFEDTFDNEMLPANTSFNNGSEFSIMVPETGHNSLIIEVLADVCTDCCAELGGLPGLCLSNQSGELGFLMNYNFTEDERPPHNLNFRPGRGSLVGISDAEFLILDCINCNC